MLKRFIILFATLVLTCTSACGFLDEEILVDDGVGKGGFSLSGTATTGEGYGVGRVCGCGGRIHVGHGIDIEGRTLANQQRVINQPPLNSGTSSPGPGLEPSDTSSTKTLNTPVDEVARHASTRRAEALQHLMPGGFPENNP